MTLLSYWVQLTINNQVLIPIGIQRLDIPHNRFCRSGGGEELMRPYDYRNSGGLAMYETTRES